jgi:hypothetical protein
MKIVGVGQILDLERGTGVANKMVVRMDDGTSHDITISEATAQELLNLVAGAQEGEAEVPAGVSVGEPYPDVTDYGEDLSEGEEGSFGEEDPGEVVGDAVMGAVSEEEVIVPTRPSGLGQPRIEEEDGVQI